MAFSKEASTVSHLSPYSLIYLVVAFPSSFKPSCYIIPRPLHAICVLPSFAPY